MWHFSLPHFQWNSYSDTFELSFMYYSLPSKFFKCHPLVQHFGGQKSLSESTMEKKPFSPPPVGGDWNMNFLTFQKYWEWNVIIPTDFISPSIFQRGRSTQPPSSPLGGFCSTLGFCRNIQRESPLHCARCQIWSGCHLAMILKPPAGAVQSSGVQSWPFF